MEHAMTQPTVEVTREKLLQDFNMVVAETEQLLKAAATAGGEKANVWRDSVEQKLKVAKDKLIQLEEAAVARTKEATKEAAQATDTYVHEKPWQAIGITAGVSVLVGVTIGLLLNRR
jgi:ElaB/YqjD/DUF883 family membrane-anchored ribosome-binding protein